MKNKKCKRSLVWLRRDLRLDDQPALAKAVAESEEVLPIYVFSDEVNNHWPLGSASKVWLHESLKSFQKDLESAGSALILKKGNAADVLLKLAKEEDCDRIYFCEDYLPFGRKEEIELRNKIESSNIEPVSLPPNLLYEQDEVLTQQRKPYQVYTPYWRSSQKVRSEMNAQKKIERITTPKKLPVSVSLNELKLLPKINWHNSVLEFWKPGVDGARENLKRFSGSEIEGYDEKRNLPYVDGTSRLSPHLHWGEVSVRRIWSFLKNQKRKEKMSAGREHYLKELVWRDFAYHLMYHFPHLTDEPLREEFKDFDWVSDSEKLERWQKGQTGYPLVDAGMRQLYQIGWMHNRVRMVVASFLVKHLRIHWLEGAKWFWDTLVDADLASNTLGWQWAAGCGPDAAPYFRIFNPITQSEKFDPKGEYIKTYVPELAQLDSKLIHQPREASSLDLSKAGIVLGKTYPLPIVDHKTAREAALKAYDQIKKKKAP